MTDAYSTPQPARRLVIGALRLYRRYPLLFLVLAGGVIVPYQLIVLAATGTGPFSRSSLGFGVSTLLTLIEWLLVGPLVSALHVHAVREVGEGRQPRLGSVTKQGLRALPVVVAASIISGLGIAAGLVALAVPGIFLMLRWYVVAQSAAIEREGWLPALRRSHQLTEGHYRHIIAFVFLVFLITSPTLLIALAFGHHTTTAASFLVGVIVQVLTWSLGALATAFLYFDLRARSTYTAVQRPSADSSPAADESEHVSHSLDPRMYPDEERPKGWYIDPADPNRMRYWSVGEPKGWGGTTRTPRRIRRDWQADARSRS